MTVWLDFLARACGVEGEGRTDREGTLEAEYGEKAMLGVPTLGGERHVPAFVAVGRCSLASRVVRATSLSASGISLTYEPQQSHRLDTSVKAHVLRFIVCICWPHLSRAGRGATAAADEEAVDRSQSGGVVAERHGARWHRPHTRALKSARRTVQDRAPRPGLRSERLTAGAPDWSRFGFGGWSGDARARGAECLGREVRRARKARARVGVIQRKGS